jgi:hypothetical protein
MMSSKRKDDVGVRRLALRRETLRSLQSLSSGDLAQVVGGASEHCQSLGWSSKFCWK